jgi:hypothetical protein
MLPSPVMRRGGCGRDDAPRLTGFSPTSGAITPRLDGSHPSGYDSRGS